MALSWQVRIPGGRWMAGVNRFPTKTKAREFMERWNETSIKVGQKPLRFIRFGPTCFEGEQ